MHYKDGTPAKLGDVVKSTSEWKSGASVIRTTFVGVLTDVQPASTCCNGTLSNGVSVREVDGAGRTWFPNAGQCSIELGKCDKVL